MRQSDPDRARPARGDVRVPAAMTSAARARRRAFKRLRMHRQFLPLLVLVTLLSTAGISALAYVGSRGNAIATAQTRAAQDAQVARDELTARGASLSLSDGRMVDNLGGAAITLNNDTTFVDHAHTLVGADISIYEREGVGLVAISTTLPAAGRQGDASHGSRDLGDVLPGDVTRIVLGSCGVAASPSCYQSYSGVTLLAGRQYVADIAPLFDASGAFVGAVGAAFPLDTVLAPTVQLSVMLLLMGALLALVSLVSGWYIYRVRAEAVLDRLDIRLSQLADAASDLQSLVHTRIDHSDRQSRVARQIAEQVRALDTMTQVMDQGHAALRDSTSEMWMELSQPGAAPDIALATRLAQQVAVASARVGSATGHARDLCRQLLAQMNHIIAEADIVRDSGRVMEQRAQELRASVEGVEMTLGERLRKRLAGASFPLARGARAVSERLRGRQPARSVPATDLSRGAASAPAVPPRRERAPARHSVPRSDISHQSAVPRRSPADPPVGGILLNSNGRLSSPAPLRARPSGTLPAGGQSLAPSGERSQRSAEPLPSGDGWDPGWLDE